MKLNDKIYIAGHRGLVGSAILRYLTSLNFSNIITRCHKALDLINQADVRTFFNKEKPDYVIIASAKVGGIFANKTYPADFIYQNLMIEANIIQSAFENNTTKLLFLGSSCIYPKLSKQPITEDALLTDVLEPSNEPYAIAKIAGIKLCESYNRQYGTDFRSIMPTNLYGENDNFHSENSHVIPALINRFHMAKVKNEKEVLIWGTGSAMREFLHVDDMARASIFVLNLDRKIYQTVTKAMLSHINVGSGQDITIRELSKIISEVVGYNGSLIFDTNKPDGTPRKLIDTSKLNNLGWKPIINLRDGLENTYKWYLKNII